jgi:hypothetical protein
MIWINVIDYRGDDTVINTRGDSLFNYRTVYFLRQQADFHHWKTAGHKFRCFTQHNDNNFPEFDDVVKIPRGNAAMSRNQVLDYYPQGTWIGIWDNDATLYFDKLESRRFIQELDAVCQQAKSQDITAFVPFNAQQSPYPINPKPAWAFKPKLEQKGTMIFLEVGDWRFDESMDALEDLEFACRLSLQGHKFAQCEQVSLKEYVNGKSTIFQINEHHKAYKKPGPGASPNGLKQWDAQIDRTEKYKKNMDYIESKLGYTIKELREKHKAVWTKPKMFAQLFQ